MVIDAFLDVHTVPEIPTYRFDLWDFGGQHVYYTMHQTFLSERAIYLLTMDMTQPLDEKLSTEIEAETAESKWKGTGSPKTARGITLQDVTV